MALPGPGLDGPHRERSSATNLLARQRPHRRAAAPTKKAAQKAAQKGEDPAHFFASRAGLVRIYEGHSAQKTDEDDGPAAGASCEVNAADAAGVRETCTMIVDRKARPFALLTYELRKAGVYMVSAQPEGAAAQALERLVLPGPIHPGSTWKETLGPTELDRTAKSVGGACKAAGKSFADCLVLSVTQKQGKKLVKKYTETYVAGVGLVEDAQWELVDIKGL